MPATSEPSTAGYSWMNRPRSRWKWSTGFRARAWTSMRSSFGPGFGVGRVVTFNGSPFSWRVVARWICDIVGSCFGLIAGWCGDVVM